MAAAATPKWELRGLPRRNKEDLDPGQLKTLRRELVGMGTYGRKLYEAWQAEELLRDLLRLTFKHACITPDRAAISRARYVFQAFCAARAFLPELVAWPRRSTPGGTASRPTSCRDHQRRQ